MPERHGFANVVSKLPFTSRDLDPATLLERKQGLEKYIQVLYSTCKCLLVVFTTLVFYFSFDVVVTRVHAFNQ